MNSPIGNMPVNFTTTTQPILMIPDLDFLPASYHQKRLQRQKKSWRGSILIAFCVLVTLGSIQIQATKSGLRSERDRLKTQTEQLEKQLALSTPIQEKIQEIDLQLNLLSLMKARVPTTRLLHEITDALPRFVSLTSIRMNVEKVPVPKAAQTFTRKKPSRKKQEEEEQLSPVETDLLALREKQTRDGLFVIVEGLAPDDEAISSSLRSLRECGLFREVSLIYTDSYLRGETTLRAFSIKLRVRNIGDDAVAAGGVQTAIRIQESPQ